MSRAVLSAWKAAGGIRGSTLRSSFTHRGYLDAVARVREYIFAGDIFQANLSQRFEAPLTEAGLGDLPASADAEPGTVCRAILDFPGVEVLSASPERFLRVDVGGHVETRPDQGHSSSRSSGPSTTPRLVWRSPRARRIARRT